ncbi:uroporphyrinogen-III synthase [Methylophaga lonarensis MPL]|uniref:Uroporphyrinogen-III synthase n=1 Tax=Methylophaga lonarensis MPL TaxID=1286106 RepID=M7PNZ8_9GAMM|nr:uroporphyrinogen-III synthase [Methylophaga lonarensis]EMR12189.1 uroporphyrinogen-III synthase [Methylophaga lonarensis MPL]
MATDNLFAGRKVLVTRPESQAQTLAAMVADRGGEAIIFPALAIAFIPATQWPQIDWPQIDWLIFVSPNAVAAFVAGYQQPLPANVKCVAVGGGTVKAMQQHGLAVDLQPPESKGSESLLTVEQFQTLQGQQIVIVRAPGGRELLAETLRLRGASVSYLNAYQRVRPHPSETACQQAAQVDYLTATSVASLDNLCALLKPYLSHIRELPLVVLSDRIQQHALSSGFKKVTVTTDASDNAIMQRLTEMEQNHGKRQQD